MRLINVMRIAALVCATGLVASCKKSSADEPDNSTNKPMITTTQVINPLSNINSTSVICGGSITNADMIDITDKGIVWGTDSSTLNTETGNKVSNGLGQSDFTDTIRNLRPNTKYYVKAYVVYNTGISYGTTVGFTSLPHQSTVYTAGCIGAAAAYWKNDSTIFLTHDNGNNTAWARSIYVVGNDVYAAGYMSIGSKTYAICWKNGKEIKLSDGTNDEYAYSIYISGNDVYAAGQAAYTSGPVSSQAKYWKNGEAIPLTDNNYAGIANSIFVSGNDIYVAGQVLDPLGYQFCAYWKNGTIVPLSDSVNAVGEALSIFVKNNDVYVAGHNIAPRQAIGGIPVATYWKNGKAVSLTDGSQDAGAYSIYVTDNNDVYVSGYEYDGSTGYAVAKYWKNGKEVILTDGTGYANATSIVVKGNDVYVCVDYYGQAACWKNGVLNPLFPTIQESRATSFFVQ